MRFLVRAVSALGVLWFALAPPAFATSVLQMSLAELTQHSELVFRGTVVGVDEVTVEAGGGQVPALRYRIEVSEAFKGEYRTVAGQKLAEITTIGSLKRYHRGEAPIEGFPLLDVGGDYLLLVGRPGSTGLTAPVGLGQGAFRVFQDATKTEVAENGFNNSGLVQGMSATLPTSGPAPYSAIADAIRANIR